MIQTPLMKIPLLTVLALGCSLPLLSAADITGKVVLKGKPPEEIKIDPLMADPNCGKLHTEPVTTRHYLVSKDGGLANVFGLPNGKYTLEAYHVKTHGANPGVTQEITVSGDTKADFTIELK